MPFENVAIDNVAGFTIGPYTQLLGDFFWVFMLFLPVVAVYLRTRSFGPTFLLLLVGSSVLNAFVPGGAVRTMLFFAVALGIAYTFYRLFVRKTGPWSE